MGIHQAIVALDGKQIKVVQDQELLIDHRNVEKGDRLSFPEVLMITNNQESKVGLPYVEGASVEAEVVEHVKGKKIIVFKKKRRKGYKVKNGFRKKHIRIIIRDIKTA